MRGIYNATDMGILNSLMGAAIKAADKPVDNPDEIIVIEKYKYDSKFISTCTFCEATLVYSIKDTMLDCTDGTHSICCPACGTRFYIHKLVPAMQTRDGKWRSAEIEPLGNHVVGNRTNILDEF